MNYASEGTSSATTTIIGNPNHSTAASECRTRAKEQKKTKPSKRKGCYHCGSFEHRGKDCSQVTCRSCGATGHGTGQCPNQHDNESKDNQPKKVQPSHAIIYSKQAPTHSPTAMHFKMYKPTKVLSQFVFPCKRQKGKLLLGDIYDFPQGTMAIGRLDADSEGLLLLTRNGKTSYQYTKGKTTRVVSQDDDNETVEMTPSIEKEYNVEVDGIMTNEALDRMRQGVQISIHGTPYQTQPCQASLLQDVPFFVKEQQQESLFTDTAITNRSGGRPTSWVSIILTEGKFRQVRKMTAAVGYPTLRLVRVRIGKISLKGLKVGQVQEVEHL